MTKEEYQQNPKYCENCGKEIDWIHRTNKFCSHSCSASFNNKLRKKLKIKKKNVRKNNKSQFNICKNCGKLLNNHQLFYCSQNCKNEFEQKEYISRWKQGLENGLKGEFQLSNYVRRYLFEIRGCKCELCGWNKINPHTNTIPVEIHHKDGNYLNNTEENLQILCPNCHSLTETYKSHNKEGRKGRKKYYSDFKK